MSAPRHKIVARLVLAFLVLAGGLWFWRFDYDRKVSTDVLELIPADEREPELALVRQLANDRIARVVLLVLRFSETQSGGEAKALRERMTDKFIETLRGSPAFAEVVRLGDTQAFVPVGKHIFDQRLDLLLPAKLASWKTEYDTGPRRTDFAHWAAEKTASELSAFLAKPEAMAFQDMLPSDPLLLVPRALEPWQAFSGMAGAGKDGSNILIWARTTASPLKEEGQAPVFKAVADAETAAAALGKFELRWSAISRFAEASRRRIEGEMSGLNLLSLVAVLAIGFAGVRRPYKALNLAPVLIFSLLGAWIVTTTVFSRVHVLVFVVGSLLGGVAVDYGFYLFLQPPRAAGEPPLEKARRLLKPLLASSLTAITGFLLLLFSDLPLIRQLGVFVSAGLLCALGAAFLWYAQSKDTWWETRALIHTRLPGAGRKNVLRWAALVACLVVAVGIARLHWRDDIRDLDISSPELRANAEEVHALFGENDSQSIYLTRGPSAAEARAALSRFHAWHAQAFPGSTAVSVGSVLPEPEQWAHFDDNLRKLADFESALRTSLAAQGFEADAFEPFFGAWRELLVREKRPAYDELVSGLGSVLSGPLGLMMEAGPKASWYATLTNHPAGAEPPPTLATVSSAQLESFNHLFGRYRVSALWLSAVGLGLVGLSVFVVYGLRRGLLIFSLPAGSCLFAFGLLGLAGQTLNLFHLLGAFLGVCLSHNYAIFSAENAARGDLPPPSIRLSAMTTAASFGVLALSHIPVISALGQMVALIVVTALLVVELEPFSREAIGQNREGGAK
ncbi:MAG: hypothetical protein QM715_06280 [Nibricoccus sp.]